MGAMSFLSVRSSGGRMSVRPPVTEVWLRWPSGRSRTDRRPRRGRVAASACRRGRGRCPPAAAPPSSLVPWHRARCDRARARGAARPGRHRRHRGRSGATARCRRRPNRAGPGRGQRAARAVRRRCSTHRHRRPRGSSSIRLLRVAILVKSLGADNHVFFRPRGRSALPLVGLARVVDWSGRGRRRRAGGGAVTRARQDRLLALLVRDGDWATAATLADALGVTPRSIRSYVTALNARVPSGAVVESGPLGYRAGTDAATALRTNATTDAGTPRDRLHTLVRALLDSPDGIDVFETADRLHVSSATLDADLARVRGLLGGTELTLERSASRARLRGTEMAQRRLLSKLAHDEMDAGSFDLVALRRTLGEDSVGAAAFGPFKTDLVAELGALGYFVNEIGIGDVVMHIAIAADRVAQDRGLDGVVADASASHAEVAAILARLSTARLGVELGAGDLQHLASLVLTRVVAPGATAPKMHVRERLDPEVEQAVRDVVGDAASEFLVDIVHEDFILRLALHVQNLRLRAREQAWSRNPLTRSLKASYPMIFELAVYIANGLHESLGIPLLDDEIAYIAMHVGGRLERSRRADQLLTATIVCPGYYELHELLRSSVDRSLGQAVEVVGVETRVDPDWASIDTDLVLTTIDPPAERAGSERIVRIQPFL